MYVSSTIKSSIAEWEKPVLLLGETEAANVESNHHGYIAKGVFLTEHMQNVTVLPVVPSPTDKPVLAVTAASYP